MNHLPVAEHIMANILEKGNREELFSMRRSIFPLMQYKQNPDDILHDLQLKSDLYALHTCVFSVQRASLMRSGKLPSFCHSANYVKYNWLKEQFYTDNKVIF